jgi:hypothetical protein
VHLATLPPPPRPSPQRHPQPAGEIATLGRVWQLRGLHLTASHRVMPTQPSRCRALKSLRDKIARTKASIERQQSLMDLLPPGRVIVAEARLAATKQRLARLYIERQLLRAELQV